MAISLSLELLSLSQQWQVLLLLVALASLVLFTRRLSNKGLRLPPGPAQAPILGNLHQLGLLPHQSLRDLARQHGPVMQLQLGTVPTVVVSSAEAAREVMKTHDEDCCTRPVSPGMKRLSYGLNNVGFAPYGPYWSMMRKFLLVELFGVRHVKAAWHARQYQGTFIGGSDTASVTILWAMAELIRKPRLLKKVQDEIRSMVGGNESVQPDDLVKLAYLKMVVKETLRLHPPATMLLPREAMRDIQIGGYDVPAKTRIYVNAWAIGRDPTSWPDDPEEFKPERFETSEIDFKGAHFELTPFGAGRRICPALSMSIATVEFTLANLLYCFDWALPKGAVVSMEEEGKLIPLLKTPLVLVPTPYRHM
ncbi:hypothetical protein VPH35_063960 [Triticum aestivum]